MDSLISSRGTILSAGCSRYVFSPHGIELRLRRQNITGLQQKIPVAVIDHIRERSAKIDIPSPGRDVSSFWRHVERESCVLASALTAETVRRHSRNNAVDLAPLSSPMSVMPAAQ